MGGKHGRIIGLDAPKYKASKWMTSKQIIVKPESAQLPKEWLIFDVAIFIIVSWKTSDFHGN